MDSEFNIRKDYLEIIKNYTKENCDNIFKAMFHLLLLKSTFKIRERQKHKFKELSKSINNSDYHGIDIIKDEKIYDEETIPQLKILYELLYRNSVEYKLLFKMFNSEGANPLEIMKEFITTKQKGNNLELKKYIQERNFRCWASIKKLSMSTKHDFRYTNSFNKYF